MSGPEPIGPKIPIPGAPGAAIFAALVRLAMHCGDGTVTVRKERSPAGGYIYEVANNHEARSK